MAFANTCLFFVSCCLLFASVHAQMSMSAEEEEMLEAMGVRGQPMGRKNQEPQAEVIKGDLKHISCGVCRKMVELAYPRSQEILEKRFKHKKKRARETVDFDGEAAIQEYVETMCLPLKPEGEWVSKIDIVQDGTSLLLATQPSAGHCRRECRTVERACNDVLDKADTEFTEILFNGVRDGATLEQMQRYICNRAAGVCKKKPPPVKNRPFDEKFKVMTAEEKQMIEMQANLKDSGMSGTMYRREDLAGMMDKLGDLTGMEGMEGMEGMGEYDELESVGGVDGAVKDNVAGDDEPDYVDDTDEETKAEL
mmetsp:Transcript_9208/g.20146  ORF Transcript_9208/g.20146 Transcript_9208/m.20146 type:complete len:309 (+) Transcript_9208:200-1126(+)